MQRSKHTAVLKSKLQGVSIEAAARTLGMTPGQLLTHQITETELKAIRQQTTKKRSK